ncbi:MAG: hypothetical protein KDC98_20020 [Planctomycetes bacterium]|nr:hypothetical protein [Planctomycetota bacterium]
MNRRQQKATAAAAALLLLLFLARTCGRSADGPWTRDELLAAIRHVESGNRDPAPDGDGGLAIGPYQIHRVYWQDAIAFRPELGGGYQDCRRRDYAERVIEAYMQLWVPEAWQAVDAEVIARTHNGGPKGAEKAATLRYWERVQSAR